MHNLGMVIWCLIWDMVWDWNGQNMVFLSSLHMDPVNHESTLAFHFNVILFGPYQTDVTHKQSAARLSTRLYLNILAHLPNNLLNPPPRTRPRKNLHPPITHPIPPRNSNQISRNMRPQRRWSRRINITRPTRLLLPSSQPNPIPTIHPRRFEI